MKRIIPILAALCLVVAMAVPALAAEEVYSLSGHWLFNQELSIPSFFPSSPTANFDVNLNFTCDGNEYVAFSFQYTKSGTDYTYKRLFYVSGDSSVVVIPYYWLSSGNYGSDSDLDWANESLRLVDFGATPQAVTESFYQWFVSNAVCQDCDPSVCSSVDADGDGYCDVCGGFFTLPPPGPLVEVMTDLKEQNQLSQVLTQIVMMIPIGLGCWVGYKGLRKALDLLRRILHQA